MPIFSGNKEYEINIFLFKNVDFDTLIAEICIIKPLIQTKMETKVIISFLSILLIAIVSLTSSCSKDSEEEKITDADGNIYTSVAIGTQVWMAENLKTTKFNDGTAIPLVTDNTEWSNLTTSGYCWYSNDESTYKNTYGALYNWYTVNTGNLCPSGWHVPSDPEWTTLTTYLGGDGVSGGKLKEAGNIHWNTPNTDATNETGFTALPGGYRYLNGNFFIIGDEGYWWTATESNTTNGWYRSMVRTSSNVNRLNYSKKDGFSVRCLRD